MPSPATSHVSLPRERSPSVDITSISPDSSIPSCSPPPPPPPPVPDEKPRPASGKSEGAGKNAKSQPNPKKRKKSDIEVPIVKPEVMPPKPPYTYAQLCYRAIKAHGGKATLQDIIGWMIDSFEWYKYNVGSGWENSVRHNLSSGKTFKKMERSQGERGKGYYWSIDGNYEYIVLEQDAKLEQTLSAANREKTKKSKGPLPPPLTSQPLAPKAVTNLNGSLSTFRALPVSTATATVVKVEHPNQLFTNHTLRSVGPGISYPPVPANTLPATHPPQIPQQPTPVSSSSTYPAIGGKAPGIPVTVRIPIIVGPVPDSYVPSASELSTSHLPTPPIVLHENTLILNPTIFGHLTSEQLKGLETLGAQKALEILQGYIVRFLKERIRTESGKGRGRGGSGVRGRGRGRGGLSGAGPRRPQVKVEGVEGSPKQPAATPNPLQPVKPPPGGDDEDVLVDIEGDTDDTERASKRRRVDDPAEAGTASDSSASSATVVPRQGSPPTASLA
ncbi:hypothetical protein BDM02DRAFT_3109550 [Thelephora ganbajun]|uniref:Uncharacterized protein n=1 Tax=Thelephora ganbajun TaxID=370292 RepID=A0ACB6ZRE0_THEGA|nr:hypothetical protein BDM02DRAFT_3109550 [Thelephora ganbajun]